MAKAKTKKKDDTEGASVISKDRAASYKTTKVKIKGDDGKFKTQTVRDNGDEVAAALRGKTTAELVAIIEANDLADRYHKLWKHLNNGMLRMNLGNALRKVVRDGGKIKGAGRAAPVIEDAAA